MYGAFYITIGWWVLLGSITHFLAGSHTAPDTAKDHHHVPLRLFQSEQRTALRTCHLFQVVAGFKEIFHSTCFKCFLITRSMSWFVRFQNFCWY